MSHRWIWDILVIVMLGNTWRSRMVRSTSPWAYLLNLVVFKRLKSHLQNQKIIWEDQRKCWLHLWVSRPLEGQKKIKIKGMPLLMSVWREFIILWRSLRNCLINVRKRPKHEPTDINFYQSRHLDKCMMRDDTFNLHVDPEITEMTSTQQIPISQV